MSISIMRFAVALYAAGAAAYILFFARPQHVRAAPAGMAFVLAGFVVHLASIGFACAEFGGREFFTVRGGLSMLAWVGAGAFLLLMRNWRIPAIGAFVLPLVLVAALPAAVGLGPNSTGTIPDSIRGPSLTVHITSATGGVAIFAIAFGVALMYLLQEREVKGKHFGALFSRLPSLDALDRLNQRLVRSGFVVYTVAVVTGVVVASKVNKETGAAAWPLDPQLLGSIFVWMLYGAMVQLRHVGIHGRKYALLTLAGFALVLGTLVAPIALPNLIKHGTLQ